MLFPPEEYCLSLRDSKINTQESKSGILFDDHDILSASVSYFTIFICAKNQKQKQKPHKRSAALIQKFQFNTFANLSKISGLCMIHHTLLPRTFPVLPSDNLRSFTRVREPEETYLTQAHLCVHVCIVIEYMLSCVKHFTRIYLFNP